MLKLHSIKPAANNNQAKAGEPLITTSECAAINDTFAIDDELGDISKGNAFWFQFAIHSSLDSMEPNPKTGEVFNRYDGFENGQGIYPERLDSPLLNRNGTFRTSKYGLPSIHSYETDGKPVELTVDAHRANENQTLKAFHLMAVRLHNVRMAVHSDYEQAKRETIALLNRITLNELEIMTGLDQDEILNDIRIPNFNNSLEFIMAVCRAGHAQMTSTVNQTIPVFNRGPSNEIDLISLFTKEKARILNLGVSKSMTEMSHIRTPHNILQRTTGRHFQHNLATFRELARLIDPRNGETIANELETPQGCPIWHGILIEAEKHGTGTLGRIGARAMADGFAASLLWGRDIAEGLWLQLWDGAPRDTVDIIDYAQSGTNMDNAA